MDTHLIGEETAIDDGYQHRRVLLNDVNSRWLEVPDPRKYRLKIKYNDNVQKIIVINMLSFPLKKIYFLL